MNRSNKKNIPEVAQQENMPEKCSGLHTAGAAQRGMGGMVYCVNKHSVVCEHAVHFGDTHYCLHPENPELTGRFRAYSA